MIEKASLAAETLSLLTFSTSTQYFLAFLTALRGRIVKLIKKAFGLASI